MEEMQQTDKKKFKPIGEIIVGEVREAKCNHAYFRDADYNLVYACKSGLCGVVFETKEPIVIYSDVELDAIDCKNCQKVLFSKCGYAGPPARTFVKYGMKQGW